MELFEGRPTDCQGRLAKEIRVYDFLDSLGVSNISGLTMKQPDDH